MEPVEAVIDAPAPEAPVVSESLADHEAQFSKGAKPVAKIDDPADGEKPEGRDEKGRFRHRAQSQQAGPEDVAAINALTKELRTKEAELAKLQPDTGTDSPRIRALKRQIKALDVDLGALKAPAAEKAPVAPKLPERSPAPAGFTEPEPKFEDFANEADQYGAYVRALARYDRRKDDYEASQKASKASEEQQYQKAVEAHKASVEAFKATHPDWDDVMQKNTAKNISPVMTQALLHSDAKVLYHLAQSPALADELFLQTGWAKPDSPEFWDLVATTQRRLTEHAKAATTGSAAPARPTYTPPASPPNPVRTGPERTGVEIPGDDASLAEHEKAYGAKRRR